MNLEHMCVRLNKFILPVIKVVIICAILILLYSRSAFAFTVVLDPGHGGEGTEHSGAVYAPFIEKSLNLAVATRLKNELEDAGQTVY